MSRSTKSDKLGNGFLVALSMSACRLSVRTLFLAFFVWGSWLNYIAIAHQVGLSCSHLKKEDPTAASEHYSIDPDGEGGLAAFLVYCDMTDKNGVGVTVISHDSESRTHVNGCEGEGCYSRNIQYTGASLSQLAILTGVSSHCEQFIKYECHGSMLLRGGRGWWVSRDLKKKKCWGGASVKYKCACGMTHSCADPKYGCNCDANDQVWREDSGLLTDKTKLPVKRLRFSDTKAKSEKGFHTLGKFKCYDRA